MVWQDFNGTPHNQELHLRISDQSYFNGYGRTFQKVLEMLTPLGWVEIEKVDYYGNEKTVEELKKYVEFLFDEAEGE